LFALPAPLPPSAALFPYTTLFRSHEVRGLRLCDVVGLRPCDCRDPPDAHHEPRDGVAERLTLLAVEEHQRPLWREPAREQLEDRSEEHTSELQSRENLVCRLLLEK